jgi:hypothetical protein
MFVVVCLCVLFSTAALVVQLNVTGTKGSNQYSCRLNALPLLDFRNMEIAVGGAVESSGLFTVVRMM